MQQSTPVAMIGCGYIADHYVESIRRYPSLRLVGVTDCDAERARRFGAFHGLKVYSSTEDLLDDQNVSVVLNLTNPRSHYTVSKACLEAGKHVYSEKPLALAFSQARELVEFAASRGLVISGAPANLLGEAAQTMWKALRENAVGKVRAVYAEMDDGPVYRMPYRKWITASGAPWPFQDEFEVGCTLEHAGYSVGLLTAFFGPAETVTSFASVQVPAKLGGVPVTGMNPDLTMAAIQHESGVVSRLTCSIIAPHDHALRVFGDAGVLCCSDVWRYDASIQSRRWITIRRRMFLTPWRTRHRQLTMPGAKPLHDDRARGVAEMAAGLAEGRTSRISPAFALHITELSLAIQRGGGVYSMTTRFDPIAPMPWAS